MMAKSDAKQLRIARVLLKRVLRKEKIELNSELKDELHNVAKEEGLKPRAVLEFGESLLQEMVKEAFSGKKRR